MNLLLILPAAENPEGIYPRELAKAFPDLAITCVEHHAQAAAAHATDVLMTFSPFIADHVVRDAPNLRWIQVLGSGVDGVVNLPSLRTDVLVTNGRGVQAAPVSECALSLMLALSRGMPRMLANQVERRWERWPSQLLEGRTLGILGVGQIGESLAQKASALGMRVIGVSSGSRPVPGFERLYPREQLREAVREMDYLVILTPYTADTHHLVNAAVLAAMKPGAFLVNVARGGVLDEVALADALRRGQIRGAALDVFEEEPLPAQSELWTVPNLILSPHLAGLNSDYPRSVLPLVIDNIALFRAGRTSEMHNIVARG